VRARINNIVLTGFMGTGKTAVARELARLTGFKVVDVDADVEAEAGMSIAEIFEQQGEAAFRDRESAALARIAGGRSQVIATGGGAVIREENRRALREAGPVVCLTASVETIHARTRRSDARPLLQTDDPMERIRRMLAEREEFYRDADVTVSTEGRGPAQVAEAILEEVGWSA
jgi:shikimate kinase